MFNGMFLLTLVTFCHAVFQINEVMQARGGPVGAGVAVGL